jgi:HPt (histidine-containing phosphotransfer) domain-containing protein
MIAPALEGDRQQCLTAGMDDYVSKPLRLTDFARMLNQWTDLRRMNEKNIKRESEFEAQPAHKLLGASANLGASTMCRICKQLEKIGRTQTLEGAIEQITHCSRN